MVRPEGGTTPPSRAGYSDDCFRVTVVEAHHLDERRPVVCGEDEHWAGLVLGVTDAAPAVSVRDLNAVAASLSLDDDLNYATSGAN